MCLHFVSVHLQFSCCLAVSVCVCVCMCVRESVCMRVYVSVFINIYKYKLNGKADWMSFAFSLLSLHVFKLSLIHIHVFQLSLFLSLSFTSLTYSISLSLSLSLTLCLSSALSLPTCLSISLTSNIHVPLLLSLSLLLFLCPCPSLSLALLLFLSLYVSHPLSCYIYPNSLCLTLNVFCVPLESHFLMFLSKFMWDYLFNWWNCQNWRQNCIWQHSMAQTGSSLDFRQNFRTSTCCWARLNKLASTACSNSAWQLQHKKKVSERPTACSRSSQQALAALAALAMRAFNPIWPFIRFRTLTDADPTAKFHQNSQLPIND